MSPPYTTLDNNSYFHIQVLGEDGRIEPPFPHSLSVPRLPALVFTPMAALEFVIAELFQDEWKQQVARETPAIQMWRSIQQKRFRNLFAWTIPSPKLANVYGLL